VKERVDAKNTISAWLTNPRILLANIDAPNTDIAKEREHVVIMDIALEEILADIEKWSN